MSFNITKQTFGLTFFMSSLLLGLFFWSHSSVSEHDIYENLALQMPFSESVYAWFLSLPQIAIQLIIGSLALLNGIFLTRTLTGNMVITARSYTPILLYTAASCGLYANGSTIIPMIASSLLIYSIDIIISSFRRIIQYGLIFNSGVLIGLAILIYPLSVAYIPILIAALIIFKKGFREWIVGFWGLLLPALLYSYILWGLDGDFLSPSRHIYDQLSESVLSTDYSSTLREPLSIAFWSLITITTIISAAKFLSQASYSRVKPHKSYTFFIWVFILTAAVVVLFNGEKFSMPMLAIPISVIMSSYFSRTNGWIPNLIFSLFIGIIVISNLITLLSS